MYKCKIIFFCKIIREECGVPVCLYSVRKRLIFFPLYLSDADNSHASNVNNRNKRQGIADYGFLIKTYKQSFLHRQTEIACRRERHTHRVLVEKISLGNHLEELWR
jgi:hypothetical protein